MLHDKYLFPQPEADAIAAFLAPMLRLHPDKRAKAADLVHHVWLDGVVVQGEVDVVRRAEEDEKKRAAGAGAAREMTAGEARLTAALAQSERDAMKPVDDLTVMSDAIDVGARPPPLPQQLLYGPPKLGSAPVPTASGAAKENAAAPMKGAAAAGPRPTSSAGAGGAKSSSAKRASKG